MWCIDAPTRERDDRGLSGSIESTQSRFLHKLRFATVDPEHAGYLAKPQGLFEPTVKISTL
jgi:hypothetical protein